MDEQANIGQFVEDRAEESESETVRLKHLAEINPKKSEISDLPPDTDVSFVSLDDFGTDGEIKNRETRALEDVYDGYTYFREGDIAIAKITPSFENGKGAICRDLENGIGFGTTELHVLRPRDWVDPRYIWYAIRSEKFRQKAIAAMRGVAGQKRIPSGFIGNYSVPNVEKHLQERVCEKLDQETTKIDEAISRSRSLQSILRNRRESFLKEYFDEFIGDADIPKLKYVSSRITSGPRDWAQYYADDGDGHFLRITNIQKNSIDLTLDDLKGVNPPNNGEAERAKLSTNDVLVSITAEIGSVGVVPDLDQDSFVNQHIAVVSPSKHTRSRWIAYYLSSYYGQKQLLEPVRGGTKDGLGLDDVGQVRIPHPTVEVQEDAIREIQESLSNLSKLHTQLREVIEHLKERKRAIITNSVGTRSDLSG